MKLENKTTAADMAKMKNIMPYNGDPAAIPVSFVYDGKKYVGLTPDMHPETLKVQIDSNIRKVIITGRLDTLEIRVEYSEYTDFPVTEWVAFFTNVGDKDSKILENAGIIATYAEDNDVLEYSNGDDGGNCGYEYFRNNIEEHFMLRPYERAAGNSGASGYMRLMSDKGGANITVGWSGRWRAEFDRVDGKVNAFFVQDRFHMYIKPGETMRTPRILVEAYAGDENHGRNMWRRFYFKHWLPKTADGNMQPPRMFAHVMNIDGHAEFTGATEENQVGGIREYIRRDMKPDGWWIDAGWYPCHYDWGHLGDWEPDPERFPNGMGPVGKECEKNGMELLLWFEPERVRPNSWLYDNHPEWILEGEDGANHLFDFGNPEALAWMTDRVDSIIKEGHVKIYRQDFNLDPGIHWVKHETADRLGALENLHTQGYYKYWDTLLERNPGLIIDSCSSGGHRNDPETMRRAITLHYTDVEYGVHPVKQKQHRLMFEWMPYFRAHTWSWDNAAGDYYAEGAGRPCDEFAFQAALAPCITNMVEYNGPEEQFEMARRMIPIWRRAAGLMTSCDYYPLTECRKNPEDFYAMEFYSPERDEGFFQVLANTKVKEPSYTAKLVVDENTDYKLENSRTGEVTVISGKQLAEGYTVEVEPRSAIVFFFEAVKK